MSQETTTGLSEPLRTLGPDVDQGSKSDGPVDANPSSTATQDQQRQTEPVLEEQMKRITALFGDAQLMCVLPDSPDILDCLRASSDPNITAEAEQVLTVRCGPQATALVLVLTA